MAAAIARRRPGADRLAARFALECAVEQGEAVRQQQRRADPLQGAGEQHLERAAQRADWRSEAEQRGPDHQPQAAPMVIAERAAEQDQRGERQRIAVDHPLDLGRAATPVEARIAGRATLRIDPSMKLSDWPRPT